MRPDVRFGSPSATHRLEPVTLVPGEVRPAIARDLDGILRCDPLAARGDRERAEFIWRALARGECHVHVSDGVVRGFVIVRPAHFFGRDFIELLAVGPSSRRRGTGRLLLRQALATARTSQVFTSTNVSNHAMRSLLRAEGWSFSGELRGLDEGDPELVFCQGRPAALAGS